MAWLVAHLSVFVTGTLTWLVGHSSVLISALLIFSEAAASVCQLLFPDNKGVSGVIAYIIKVLQSLGKQ
jgi:hypothetical protein